MRGSWDFQMRRCGMKTILTEPASVKNQFASQYKWQHAFKSSKSWCLPTVCETAQPRSLLRLWQPLSLLWEQTCRLVADSLEVGGSTRPYSKKRVDFFDHSVFPLHVLWPLLSVNNIFNNCSYILKMCCIMQLHIFRKLTATLWWIAWQSKI